MGKVCEICGKGTSAGNKVSHSNRKTRRVWKPNIQRLLIEKDGSRRRIYVCTQCLKSGRVQRPALASFTSSQIR